LESILRALQDELQEQSAKYEKLEQEHATLQCEYESNLTTHYSSDNASKITVERILATKRNELNEAKMKIDKEHCKAISAMNTLADIQSRLRMVELQYEKLKSEHFRLKASMQKVDESQSTFYMEERPREINEIIPRKDERNERRLTERYLTVVSVNGKDIKKDVTSEVMNRRSSIYVAPQEVASDQPAKEKALSVKDFLKLAKNIGKENRKSEEKKSKCVQILEEEES